MIDFLFSFEKGRETSFTEALSRFRPGEGRPVKSFSGEWGTLVALGRAYPCFDPVETDCYIIVVLGGPLPRDDYSAASGDDKDDGTRWILENWKQSNLIKWDDDLVGNFQVFCVDKINKTAEIVTDINSFVPAYYTENSPRVIGSHADAVAMAADVSHDIDPVSVADFLSYATVTYPYTMYKPVKHLSPASVTRFNSGASMESATYWLPVEEHKYGNIKEAAEDLRSIITENVKRICAGQSQVGLLVSGGEDSRVVASLIPKSTHTKAITITDTYNREARIAEKVCKRLGIEWQSVLRSPTHYLDHARESICLSESHNLFLHAHINGFVEYLPGECRVLGAVGADAFSKCSHVKGKSFAGYKISKFADAWQYGGKYLECEFSQDVENRRRCFNSDLIQIRSDSWAEWHSLFPATMNTNFSNLIINRRIFPNYEPFTDSRIVKLSALVPQQWKINRCLFHRSMRPELKKTWDIPHGNGNYPYFGTITNYFLRKPYGIKLKVLKKVRQDNINNGPWQSVKMICSNPGFSEIMSYDEDFEKAISLSNKKNLLDLIQICKRSDACSLQLRRLQAKLWLGNILKVCGAHE